MSVAKVTWTDKKKVEMPIDLLETSEMAQITYHLEQDIFEAIDCTRNQIFNCWLTLAHLMKDF